jgi:hypothetical protein
MAARRTPASLVAVASQPEMDTQVGDMEARGRSSVRTAVLDNLWLADLTQMQATYAQCPEADQGGFQCSADSGRCPASIAHGSCNYECKEWQALRDGFAIGSENGSISAHMHSCMHCGRAQSDTMVAAVHRMLQCAAMASNVAQFKDKDFGQSMDWDASPDALVLSILSPEGR